MDCPPIAHHAYRSSGFAQSLVSGDEDGVTAFVCAFLRGAAELDERILDDRRPLPTTMIVRIPTKEHYYQFSPALVADAASCLLSVRYNAPTSEILRPHPELGKLCGEGCDVCSSRIIALDERVRAAEQAYWKDRIPH